MAFGVNSKLSANAPIKIDAVVNGKHYSSEAITLIAPDSIQGYVNNARLLNIYINGFLANEVFTISPTSSRVSFNYTGDTTKFSKPIVIRLEIEK